VEAVAAPEAVVFAVLSGRLGRTGPVLDVPLCPVELGDELSAKHAHKL
jgi:hypothetical protein